MERLHLIIGKNCRVGLSVTDGNKSLCRRGSLSRTVAREIIGHKALKGKKYEAFMRASLHYSTTLYQVVVLAKFNCNFLYILLGHIIAASWTLMKFYEIGTIIILD